MTWIKPSFLWMMYRCGWAAKEGQETVLAIEITREVFEWALKNEDEDRAVPGHWVTYVDDPLVEDGPFLTTRKPGDLPVELHRLLELLRRR